jgi:hypothetical protein
MESVSQEPIAQLEELEEILTTYADELAHETFLVRQRQLSGSALALTLIFGWLQEPDITLDGLCQVLQRCKIGISASGLNQRFTPKVVTFFERILDRLVQANLRQDEIVDHPLFQSFSAVIVEDSTTITLPDALAGQWEGCGGDEHTSGAALKLMVRWNLSSGQVLGPTRHAGKAADVKAAIAVEELPEGCLYLADLGFWDLMRFLKFSPTKRQRKRFFLSRYKTGTTLLTKGGHRLDLRGVLPQQVGQVIDMRVLLGQKVQLPVRLIAERVPPKVAEQRQERLRREAQAHGRTPSEESLWLANWTILITNVPRTRLSSEQVLVMLHVRWQIECLFCEWKSQGGLTHWRSKNPFRILCEVYAKLCALVIQQWLIALGCWDDPMRSLTKAAQAIRREAGYLMRAVIAGTLGQAVPDVLCCLHSGCRVNTRQNWPATAQYLQGHPLDRRPRPIYPPNFRRTKHEHFPCGEGWSYA